MFIEEAVIVVLTLHWSLTSLRRSCYRDLPFLTCYSLQASTGTGGPVGMCLNSILRIKYQRSPLANNVTSIHASLLAGLSNTGSLWLLSIRLIFLISFPFLPLEFVQAQVKNGHDNPWLKSTKHRRSVCQVENIQQNLPGLNWSGSAQTLGSLWRARWLIITIVSLGTWYPPWERKRNQMKGRLAPGAGLTSCILF